MQRMPYTQAPKINTECFKNPLFCERNQFLNNIMAFMMILCIVIIYIFYHFK